MRKKAGMYLKNRRIRFIAVLSVIVILVLAVFVGHTINGVNRRVTQSCFDELSEAATHLADDMFSSVRSDRTALSAIAAIIASRDAPSDGELCHIVDTFGFESSYISYLEILRPDGTMLDADGAVRDVRHALDFSAEAAKGENISDICQSTRDGRENVIRHAVPIVKEGQTVGILYGVVRLSDLAENYRTNLYGGHAYVYIVDGDTGNFILDTWHKSLGNIVEMGERKTLPGYSFEDAEEDVRSGVGGRIAFVSRTTGNVLYMRYEPIGINNWTVIVTVEEGYALEKSKAIRASLYFMATVIGAVMLLYTVCVIVSLLGAYEQVRRMGAEDQSTGLQNRNMYDQFLAERQAKMFPSITCAYVDVNGLHSCNNRYGHAMGDRMLLGVANALKREFDHASLFRVGGDEFVAFSETDDLAACSEKIRRVETELGKDGYSISSGVLCFANETGLDRIAREADELMLNNKEAYYKARGCGRT